MFLLMKRCLLFILFATITTITQAQLEEDFDPYPTGWTLDKSAKFEDLNGNKIVLTSGAGNNVPSVIGTPAVSKTSNTMKVCIDIWAYDATLNNQIPFPCDPTYADILFVKSTVTDDKDLVAANIITRIDNYELLQAGGRNCFTFTFPSGVTDPSFKVFLSFHGDCGTGGFKYVIDNVSISGVALICEGSNGTNCPPVALPDVFNRGNGNETEFTGGALYGSTSGYPGGFTVDATGNDSDPNDAYADMKWDIVTPPVNGTVTINPNGTFTVTRSSTTVTQVQFTYRISDNGPDNDINTTGDNMTDEAIVTVNWPAGGTLPVSLVNFAGSRTGNNVTLSWTTNMEMNNTGFEIQRSSNNGVYEKVGFVATKASNGNSDVPLSYQFTETNMAKANSWYRLVQIDKDGTRKVTPVRGIRGLEEISKLTVYPNPGTTGNMNVLFGSSASRNILIIDLNGKAVKQWNNYNEDNMAISGLRTGVYMLIVTNKGTNEKLTQKIVVL
jgi:hypothetical protein